MLSGMILCVLLCHEGTVLFEQQAYEKIEKKEGKNELSHISNTYFLFVFISQLSQYLPIAIEG